MLKVNGFFFLSIRENVTFDFSIFLEIVNCDFAQNFTVDGTHCQGDRIKISHVGNFFNSKKLGGNNFDFFQFSRKGCGIFAFRLRRFTDLGVSMESPKKIRGFRGNFSARGRHMFFIGVYLKVQ